VVVYFSHLALVAAAALFFALIGVWAAPQTASGDTALAFGNFVYVSVGLALVGPAAASADVVLSQE
jgi:hypothetical protein